MNNKYSEEVTALTDEQLVEMVTVHRDSYEPLAVEAARLEIYKRNGDTEKVEELEMENSLQGIRARSVLRLVNFFIDHLAFYFLSMVVTVIINLFYMPDYTTEEYSSEEKFIGYFSLAFTYFFYYIVLEYLYQKTIGKVLTRTSVVSTTGEPLTLTTVIIRTLCRLIPFEHLSFLFSKSGLHDSLSGTLVVKDVE
ncbi:RDD family protein [Sabulibacter ruber]|uniref:RDD family protein n=1 Tax=Sabulibacter ruber TaxID=2811901 RepID=UPI001A95F159|nr:RDD family protein [Sabulibacter ruber]